MFINATKTAGPSIVILRIILTVLMTTLIGLCTTQQARAQVWSAQTDYFGWFGDSPNNTPNATTLTTGINASASPMSGGAGVTMNNITESNGSTSASVFQMVNVNSDAFATAVANNDYIRNTVTIGNTGNRVRLTQVRTNGWSGSSGGQFFLSMTIVDLTTNASTTVFQELSVPAVTSGASQVLATPYEMLPGRTYEVRWYVNTNSTANTTRVIDNPILSFQSLTCNTSSVAPALSATSKGNTCPATTVDLTTLTASNIPTNTVLEYHTATPVTVANKVNNPASVTAGTYYAVFYDAINNCYSNTSGSAGTTTVTATTATCNNPGGTVTNVCPATTVDLTIHAQGTPPNGTTITWHTGTPATSANKVANPTAVGAGTYYAAFESAADNCYSPTMGPVTAVISTLCISTPPAQTAIASQPKTGNAATELAPVGGTSPYVYSNGAGDAACVSPGGATALPASSNLTVNATTGAYSYTAPSTPGTYYFCIKVCDSATPTASCKVASYTLTVLGLSDLVVAVAQPSPALVANQTSTIPVSVSNIGATSTTGPITATLTIPSSVSAPATFTSNGFGCSTSGTLVTCTNAGPIANGASITFGIPVTPLAAAVGTTPIFLAQVATPGESNTANNTASMTASTAVACPVGSAVPTLK